MRFSLLHASLALFVGAAPALAQQAADPSAAAIARGWAAVGTGSTNDAVRVADDLLAARPRDHRALTLKIDAVANTDPIRALDAYEQWLTRVHLEDPFLLESVARGTLERIAATGDTALKIDALERLVHAGVDGARERLAALRTEANAAAADAALARLGDDSASRRLIAQASGASSRGAEAIAEALPAAGQSAIPALRGMLSNPAGPVRAAALKGLGKLGARTALNEIRTALKDPDPLVQAYAAVALARFGDSEGETRVTQMLASPVGDMRLIAAEAYADRGNGPWVSAIMPLLKERGGLTRLRAAELVAPYDPQAAQAVLTEASADKNPVVRAEAIRVIEEVLATPQTPPTGRQSGACCATRRPRFGCTLPEL
jgi:HEAT repeat protein